MTNSASQDSESFAARLADVDEQIRRRSHKGLGETSASMSSGDSADLCAAVACLERLENLWPRGGKDAGSSGDSMLGDFRLIREIGRGGMGVVYEAEQLSLSRRVALKVLPFASVLDDRQIQRFKNESLAAAQLDHPNIVHVYGTGCERGVHYYAMQFIEGQTLADAIADLRRSEKPQEETISREHKQSAPAFVPVARSASSSFQGEIRPTCIGDATDKMRNAAVVSNETSPLAPLTTVDSFNKPAYVRTVAQLGAQVAEALDHAHQQGVVHRDIKPSNLMLDAGGKPWITDFGLAQIETDTSLTMSGDLLGTLRYMSPEQARATRVLIDHRTDIYSLAVTLYELLTLRPAFPGTNRQEILHRISCDDPTAPRKLNRAIPPELETIIVKAIAKEPSERYATSQELADDLQRYLEHKPIQARKPGVLQRAAKWSRRHRAVVRTAVVTAVVVIAVAAVAIWQERTEAIDQRDQAIQNERFAREEGRRADENLRKANQAALRAEQRRSEAEKEQRRAERNYGRTLAAVNRMMTRVSEEILLDEPKMDHLRRRLLGDALAFYQQILDEEPSTPTARLRLSKSYRQMGELHRELEEFAKAEEELHKSIAIAEQLAAEFPGERRYHEALASSLVEAGNLLGWSLDRLQDSEAMYWRAIRLLERADSDSAEAWDAYLHLGSVLQRLGRLQDAEASYRKALDLINKTRVDATPTARDLNNSGAVNQKLASLLDSQSRFEEARPLAQRAIADQEAALKQVPQSRTFRYNLQVQYYSLAVLQQSLRDQTGAEIAIRRAIELAEDLVSQYPTIPDYRDGHATSLAVLSNILSRTGRHRESTAVAAQARTIEENLESDFPDSPRHQEYLAAIISRQAQALTVSRNFKSAQQSFRESLSMFERLITRSPETVGYRKNAAITQLNFGKCLLADGRADAAAEQFRLAAELQKGLISGGQSSASDARFWGQCCQGKATALAVAGRQGEYAKALRETVEAYTTAIERDPKSVWAFRARGLCFVALNQDAKAIADFEQAIRLGATSQNVAWKAAIQPILGTQLQQTALQWAKSAVERDPAKAINWFTLGITQYRNGHFEASVASLEKFTRMVKQLGPLAAFFLAMDHWKLGRQSEARRWYDEAVRRMPTSGTIFENAWLVRTEVERLLGIGTEGNTDDDPEGRDQPLPQKNSGERSTEPLDAARQ